MLVGFVSWWVGRLIMVPVSPLVSFREMESNSKHVCFSVVFTQHFIPFRLFNWEILLVAGCFIGEVIFVRLLN